MSIDVPKGEVYILSPTADQSMALARLLKRADVTTPVVGVTTPGESRRSAHLYDKLIAVDNFSFGPSTGAVMPTNARQTEQWLASADCQVGEITHSQRSLAVFEKGWLLSRAAEVGVPIPKTWYSPGDFDDDCFPVFYKQRHEQGGGVRGIARNRKQLPQHASDQLIFQTYIDSAGTYGVSFLAKDGDILVEYCHFERESYPREGGSAVFIEEYSHAALSAYTRRLAHHLKYSGWGLAEYKHCPRSGTFVLMEINAKLWASCEFAFGNEPEFLRLLFGKSSRPMGVDRMVFLNRALARGPLYCILHFRQIMKAERVLYPGWVRSFIGGCLTGNFRRRLQALARELSGRRKPKARVV